jgi:hypothetical protein
MRAASTGILVAAVIALGGCRVYSEPEYATGYVELTSAPADLSVYPSTYYEGRTVYLVNDRWMYPDRGRWVYYRREPPQLYRQRTVVRQAPPAYGRGGYQRSYPQSAPQAYPQYRNPGVGGRVVAPPAAAPPATRVQ